MSDSSCSECGKSKTSNHCEVCENRLCKKCTQFLSEETFKFLDEKSEDLSHLTYCGPCFDEKVTPTLSIYEATMERARNVVIFYKTQKKDIPLIKKSKEICKVNSCPDRDEVVMRLAFFAAQRKFNAVIDVDVVSERVQNQSRAYQFNKWHGVGVPAQIDEEKLARLELLNQKGQKI